MDNYVECLQKMKDFQEFTHSGQNMRGRRERGTLDLIYKYSYDYSIYSYRTIICIVNFDNNMYVINPYRYSTTTAKHKFYIRIAAQSWEIEGYENVLWL